MAKIKYDSNYLDLKVKPYVSNAIDYLQDASRSASSMSIPNDFKYRDDLKNLSQNIKNITTKVQDFNDWIKNCNKIFSEVETQHSRNISRIDNLNIKQHNRLT